MKRHWSVEILNFRDDVEQHLTPSIRRLIRSDLERLHAKAAIYATNKLADQEPAARIDQSRRWSLPQLLGEKDDPISDLITRG